MPLVQAEVLTPWTVTNDGPSGEPINVPQVAGDHPLVSWCDTTGQDATTITADHSMVVLEIVVEEPILTGIEADPHCVVLWSSQGDRTRHRDRLLPQSEWSKLRKFFVAKGVQPRSIDSVLGTRAAKSTRGRLANDLKAWLRDRQPIARMTD